MNCLDRRSDIRGLKAKMGLALPIVESLPGKFSVVSLDGGNLEAELCDGIDSIRVRVQAFRTGQGSFDALVRRCQGQGAGQWCSFAAKISGRPWVDDGAQIVILANRVAFDAE